MNPLVSISWSTYLQVLECLGNWLISQGRIRRIEDGTLDIPYLGNTSAHVGMFKELKIVMPKLKLGMFREPEEILAMQLLQSKSRFLNY